MEMCSISSHLWLNCESLGHEKLQKGTVTTDIEVVHRQIGGDKFKYTFQRRRKKKLTCLDGNFSVEEVLKLETDERPNCSQEPENVVDLTSSESSQHSMQQLVEVA